MKKIIQTIMVVPISETIGKAFGRNTLLGTGAAIVTARFVLRSFSSMVAFGILAGGLNYIQKKANESREKSTASNNEHEKSANKASL